ncbi:MAG: sigma-54-dependent Fis family transcriptional regulator [Betaproteobacteria bacterium]|nr:sigma-54-dependent Fis family transcriptional regulator [Betaproteobacteria bacterium]
MRSAPGAAARLPRMLVVDDDEGMRAGIEMLLRDLPYEVTYRASLKEARESLGGEAFDLVVTDLRLARDSGLDVIRQSKAADPAVPVILMTSFSSLESAISALRLGACEYIIKPFANDEFLHAVERALGERRLRQENAVLRRSLRKVRERKPLIGEHASIRRVMEIVRRVAPSDVNVLILGESGTGKELVAQALHYDSPRADGPLVTVNCGAIPSELVEAELFGHARGAYTGAVTAGEGLVREAHLGTLFLDEIGEMPLATQVKFLRVLEEKTVRPVGSREVHPVDVRIVAATNKDLKAASERGEFREDLYYRLNVIDVTMPSLRERGRDIDLLAEHFVVRYAARFGKRVSGMDRSFKEFLHAHDWPGNVRELENLVERAVLLTDQETLTRSDLDGGRHARAPEAAAEGDDGHPLSVENYIRQTVLKHQDQYSELELASLLGIGRKALWTRRRRWGLPRQGRPGKGPEDP